MRKKQKKKRVSEANYEGFGSSYICAAGTILGPQDKDTKLRSSAAVERLLWLGCKRRMLRFIGVGFRGI